MRKALLVGINKYKLPGSDLNGCINDIHAMNNILVNKFNFNDIRILTDHNATKAAIENELRWLVDSPPDSSLLFHFSGHGTQIPDYNSDESDGRDECLCPYDVSDASSLILDDTLLDIFNNAKGSRLYVLADCCHSGTLNREYGNPMPMKIRFLDIPGVSVNPSLLVSKSVVRGDVVEGGDFVVLSGCRDNQTSADAWLSGRYHGAMTYSLIKAIEHDPTSSWRNIHGSIINILSREGFDQIPQLSGPSTLLDSPFLL